MEYRVVPLDKWPGPRLDPSARRKSQFKASHEATLKLLADELGHLKASNVVLQMDVDERHVRKSDGMLKADARPRSPGVVLSFDSRHGPLSYPCETFETWQDNLRGIALGLECLRAVDRYGVTRAAEQYKGWAALPAPPSGSFASAREAAVWLGGELGLVLEHVFDDPKGWKDVKNWGKGKFHPDRNGGARAKWDKLQEAICLIEQHYGM